MSLVTNKKPENLFAQKLADHSCELHRSELEVLQVNVGRLCNQTCRHCHVNAGPNRKELMSLPIAKRCVEILDEIDSFHTLDITGGAPEMAPVFRTLVQEGHARGKHVIDRCNLTILTEPGYEDLRDFLRDHRVDIVASLPCYSAENVDKQRGDGVFERSIQGLKLLNEVGYGQSEGNHRDGDLTLDLVYNPSGPSLPPAAESLEQDYRDHLKEEFGIVFDHLITITNIPIGRFKSDLLRSDRYEEYIDKLDDAFNPSNVPYVMCRNYLSVDHEGYLFDCDFNQMINLPLAGKRRNILDFNLSELSSLPIATGTHCLGCVAGAGSSCAGSLS
jgi:radical SAM/Cys-rich protein